MPGYSRWTVAQSQLATSDAAVTELTSKKDFWIAWDTCGRSFAGDEDHVGEPTLDWMLSSVDGFGPTHLHYAKYITFILTLDRLSLVRKGGGFLAIRDEQGNIAAVAHALKMRGGEKPRAAWSMWRMISGGITLGVAKRIPEIVKSKDRELKSLFKQINEQMKIRGKALGNVPNELHAKHGAAPYHYYVSIAAVEPTQQGKGHGSRLLRAIHRIADSEGVPLFLDCSSERNVAVYKKAGYEVVDQQTVTMAPGDELTVYAMVRQPGATGST